MSVPEITDPCLHLRCQKLVVRAFHLHVDFEGTSDHPLSYESHRQGLVRGTDPIQKSRTLRHLPGCGRPSPTVGPILRFVANYHASQHHTAEYIHGLLVPDAAVDRTVHAPKGGSIAFDHQSGGPAVEGSA